MTIRRICPHCSGRGTDGVDEYGEPLTCATCEGEGGLCGSCGEPSSVSPCPPCAEREALDEEANRQYLNREYLRDMMP